MSTMRRYLRTWLPSAIVDPTRELYTLPAGARGGWWQARVHRFRRAEEELLPAHLAPPVKLLTVCYGNIYRSPLAEALLKQEASARRWSDVTVRSAGLVQREGRPSPADALEAARELGVTLESHASTRLTRTLVDEASLVIVMDRYHEALLLQAYPHVLPRLVELWRFVVPHSAGEDVLQDPYGRGSAAVRECYRRIAGATHGLASALQTRFSRAD
jgi:protein-tyrosine phosphatase